MDYIQKLLRRHKRIALALEAEPMMLPDEGSGGQREKSDLQASREALASEQARLAAEQLYTQLLQAQQSAPVTASAGARVLQERLLTQTQAIPQQIRGVSEQVRTIQERLPQTVSEALAAQMPSTASSQVSMEDISRYFERDARRYGG